MSNIKAISAAKSDRNEVNEVLQEAIAQEFESVLIVGFKKGTVSFKRSKLDNTVMLIGAIEAAKMQLWESS